MLADHALKVAQNGYHILPVLPNSKKTFIKDWQSFCEQPASPGLLASWIKNFGDHGIGIACGHSVVAVDIDALDADRARELDQLTRLFLGDTPFIRTGRHPKLALVYAVSEPILSRRIGKVDILANGRYFVAFGIHPDTKQPYRWDDQTPTDLAVSSLPTITPSRMDEFIRALQAFQGLSPDVSRSPPGLSGGSPARPPKSSQRWPNANDLIVDGRDIYIFYLAAQAVHEKAGDIDAATEWAWQVFQQTAELTRNKRDGSRPWQIDDVREKVKRLAASPRRSKGMIANESSFWTSDARCKFVLAVAIACAEGAIRPAAWRLSQLMLSYIHADGGCYASVETLVSYSRLSESTVKLARRNLIKAGLWLHTGKQGGSGLTNVYRPNPAALAYLKTSVFQAEETVDETCAMNEQLLSVPAPPDGSAFLNLVLKK